MKYVACMKDKPNVQFNTDAFALALDAVRGAKNLRWKNVAEESGISASSLCRILKGHRPDADTLARLINWCGMDFRHFIRVDKQGARS
jgi:transcriptional regulator with XRE-family HTH domain